MQKTKPKKAGYEDEGVAMFEVSYKPERIGNYIINIYSGIESPEQFTDAIQVLEMADEQNGIVVNLQCPGGSLDAVDAFIHAMQKCEGHIHVVATGGCHSAATLILLEADSYELSEGFSSLIHCGSLGAVGSFNEFNAQVKFNAAFMPKTLRRHYEGFLDEKELDELMEGRDIWLDGESFATRYTARNEYFKAKNEEACDGAKEKKQRKKKVVAIDE